MHPTDGPQHQISFLYPTLRYLGGGPAGALSKLGATGDIHLVYTKVVIPVALNVRQEDNAVDVVMTGPPTTKLSPSVPALLAQYGGVDGTEADRIGSMVNDAISVSYIKKHYPNMLGGLSFHNDVREMYLIGHRQPEGHRITSCMSHGTGAEYIAMYTHNSPTVLQGVSLMKNGLMEGRTLLWGNKDGQQFYDRLYTSPSCSPDKFSKALLGNGFKPVSSPECRFAAILELPDNGVAVPYMDTVQWGAMVGPKHLLLATSAVVADQGLIKSLLGISGLPDEVVMTSYTNTTGGPLHVRCTLGGNSITRSEALKRGPLWFSRIYKDWEFKKVRFCGYDIEVPWTDGRVKPSVGLQHVEKIIFRITGSSPCLVENADGTLSVESLVPRNQSGGVVMNYKGGLGYFCHGSTYGGASKTFPVRLERYGGFPGIFIDSSEVSPREFSDTGQCGYEVRKNGKTVGLAPSWTETFAQALLQNGTKFFVISDHDELKVNIPVKAGVLIAQ